MHLFIALFNESGYVEASSPNKSVEVTARVVASRFPDRQQSRAGADDDDNERLHRWQSSETERSISDDDATKTVIVARARPCARRRLTTNGARGATAPTSGGFPARSALNYRCNICT